MREEVVPSSNVMLSDSEASSRDNGIQKRFFAALRMTIGAEPGYPTFSDKTFRKNSRKKTRSGKEFRDLVLNDSIADEEIFPGYSLKKE